MTLRDNLADARAQIEAGQAALSMARKALETAIEASLQQDIDALPSPSAPVIEHRREHRSGPPPRIPGDAELQAFILARLDRLTFKEIAAEVAQHFPANRRVGKTTIWEWWRKSQSGDRRKRR